MNELVSEAHKARVISPDNLEVRQRDGFSYWPLIETSEGLGLSMNLVEAHGRHYRTAVQGVTRTYTVMGGEGTFTLDGKTHDVKEGNTFLIPDGHEYEYDGDRLMLLEVNVPGATKANETNLDAKS